MHLERTTRSTHQSPVDTRQRTSICWSFLCCSPSGIRCCGNPPDSRTCCCVSTDDTSDPRVMACFKRPEGDQPGGSPRDQSVEEFTKENSALVRQASNVAARVQKQQEKKSMGSYGWNVLRRKSTADCAIMGSPNMSDATKRRHFNSLGGGALSPRFSFDSAKRHLLQLRRQTTLDPAQVAEIPAGKRLSIVARDWDSVEHKVHDPESDVGGVYIGDDEKNDKPKMDEFQKAFTAMKISESTDHTLTMIDDEA